MLIFSPVRTVYKRKSNESAEEILRRLDDFLNTESPQLATWLYSVFQDQQAAVTYKELREAAMNGYEEQILQWQDDYARLINERLAPIYLAAMKAGAKAWEEKLGGVLLDDSDRAVQNWIRDRTAALVTSIGEETRAAIKTILWKGQQENWTAEQIARHIRPCIGLTKSDAVANARYQQSVYDSLLKAHPRMTEASAAKKAQEAALKYAARQHRARADMIANTELAFAYNRGENMSIRNAMREGLMGACVKVWRTAGSERVCPKCGALNGKVVGFDESFDIGGREMFPGMHETPPAHPRCRCVVQYKETTAPARRGGSQVELPQKLGDIDGYLPKEVNPRAQKLFQQYLNDENFVVDDTLQMPMAYNPDTGKIHVNPREPTYSLYDKEEMYAHEIAHLIDGHNGLTFAMAQSINSALTDSCEYILANRKEYQALMDGADGRVMSISDMFAAITNNEVVGTFGHEAAYWEIFGRREFEFIANMMTIYYTGLRRGEEIINGIPALKKFYRELKEQYGLYSNA